MKQFIYYFLNFLKGILLGFVCVATPGVSGGTIAVIVGLFTTIIEAGNDLLHNFFSKKWWTTVLFFVVLVLGVAVGAFIGSKVVSFTFEKYPLAVTLCLIGLIIGSLPMLFVNIKPHIKKVSNIITFVIVVALALVYTFCLAKSNNNPLENMNFWSYLGLVIMGIVTVATMIIPGISGNIFLMAFGYYYPLTNILSNITSLPLNETLPIILVFLLGCVIGAILIVKVIKFLLDKFEVKTNTAIFAFVVSSPIIMIKLCLINNENFVYNNTELIVGIALAIVAFSISFILGRISTKKQQKEKESTIVDSNSTTIEE